MSTISPDLEMVNSALEWDPIKHKWALLEEVAAILWEATNIAYQRRMIFRMLVFLYFC